MDRSSAVAGIDTPKRRGSFPLCDGELPDDHATIAIAASLFPAQTRPCVHAAAAFVARTDHLAAESDAADRAWVTELWCADSLKELREGRGEHPFSADGATPRAHRNRLHWHLAYAEIVFAGLLSPDADRQHLQAAIDEYSRRQRRFGANQPTAVTA
jgi:Putative undecaprenyl diphosphate synthase